MSFLLALKLILVVLLLLASTTVFVISVFGGTVSASSGATLSNAAPSVFALELAKIPWIVSSLGRDSLWCFCPFDAGSIADCWTIFQGNFGSSSPASGPNNTAGSNGVSASPGLVHSSVGLPSAAPSGAALSQQQSSASWTSPLFQQSQTSSLSATPWLGPPITSSTSSNGQFASISAGPSSPAAPSAASATTSSSPVPQFIPSQLPWPPTIAQPQTSTSSVSTAPVSAAVPSTTLSRSNLASSSTALISNPPQASSLSSQSAESVLTLSIPKPTSLTPTANSVPIQPTSASPTSQPLRTTQASMPPSTPPSQPPSQPPPKTLPSPSVASTAPASSTTSTPPGIPPQIAGLLGWGLSISSVIRMHIEFQPSRLDSAPSLAQSGFSLVPFWARIILGVLAILVVLATLGALLVLVAAALPPQRSSARTATQARPQRPWRRRSLSDFDEAFELHNSHRTLSEESYGPGTGLGHGGIVSDAKLRRTADQRRALQVRRSSYCVFASAILCFVYFCFGSYITFMAIETLKESGLAGASDVSAGTSIDSSAIGIGGGFWGWNIVLVGSVDLGFWVGAWALWLLSADLGDAEAAHEQNV
ncbi:uncharacterized protein BJ171DRAFT_490719 [Polychytrium aggregatum]|uniref:uncharacterized protein n=1 Tax=Polychytrium aggregatum TaxID=110093 RepID=UPI0022FF0A4D|nr:uncharacterized protein BJ171DRAFT_490719 [Polychytrium aggregatum]KAI9208234.1 hypothetical protein BJ171DRAFT_490719 [Polychytrium aggregatum]